MEVTDEELKVYEDLFFELETGSTGFVGYIKLNAQEGITFSRARSSSSGGLIISGTGAYIYWVIEFLVIGGIAALMASGRAGEPFSEETQQWYGNDEYVATIPSQAVNEYHQLLKDGNFAAAGQLMRKSEALPPRVDVYVKRVDSPTADVVLVIKKLTPKKNGVDTDDLHTGMLSPMEFSQLQNSMQQAANAAAQ